ncbi:MULTISPECIES: DapH/DapD/GlmU-related protein [Erysipelothrix]|uniref:DapH/DapD/GlmU-related protein n=1 Tax=Erysipelothrix TaxID=1647 RepID=UPI001A9DACB0|nr:MULTISPECIES: DapH/DapD/GlmU-related protein [Erysipelothrix]
MTEKEKMIQGMLYDAGDPELQRDTTRAREIVIAAAQIADNHKRSDLYKQIINAKGYASFGVGLKLDYGYNVTVGDNFYCNYDCVMLDVCPITFGDNCMLGPAVQIYTATHPLDATERNSGLELGKPITIGDNVWIGGAAVIYPGVTLGDNVVVAGGSVVTKSFPNNVLIGGNPAKVLKEGI